MLLMIIRTLLLALLLLTAFLKPLLSSFGSSKTHHGAGRAVILIIDHSLSMEYRAGGGIGCRQRAETEADKILATLGAEGFLVNVIVAGQRAKVLFLRAVAETR